MKRIGPFGVILETDIKAGSPEARMPNIKPEPWWVGLLVFTLCSLSAAAAIAATAKVWIMASSILCP